jgi:hypothetical protein
MLYLACCPLVGPSGMKDSLVLDMDESGLQACIIGWVFGILCIRRIRMQLDTCTGDRIIRQHFREPC